MPRGDGTGPTGKGPMTGRGRRGSSMGGSAGRGAGAGAGGEQVKMGGRGAGPGGECVCPQCGERTPHQTGTPCFEQKCPKCNASMVRG